MAAIIRVKRRLDEDPAESIIVHCKKSKLDDSKTEIPARLRLNLVTTVKSKDAAISSDLRKTLLVQGCHDVAVATKKNVRGNRFRTAYRSLHHGSRNMDATRDAKKAMEKANRYKIINSRRAIVEDAEDQDERGPEPTAEVRAKKECVDEKRPVDSSDQDCKGAGVDKDKAKCSETSPSSSHDCAGAGASGGSGPVIHDVEIEDVEVRDHSQVPTVPSQSSGITLNGQVLESSVSGPSEANNNYVYDLYYLMNSSQGFDFRDIENIVSVEALHDDLVFESDLRECEDVDTCYDEEVDINDENHAANDYPDEEDYDEEEGDSDYDTRHYEEEDYGDYLTNCFESKLRLFGDYDSDKEEASDCSDYDFDDYDENTDCYGGRHGGKGSSYESYMRHIKGELHGKDGYPSQPEEEAEEEDSD